MRGLHEASAGGRHGRQIARQGAGEIDSFMRPVDRPVRPHVGQLKVRSFARSERMAK